MQFNLIPRTLFLTKTFYPSAKRYSQCILSTIIIIMSCRQHGYPWPSFATSPYRSSPPAGLQGYIPYPHIAVVCMFELVVLLLLGHMWGSLKNTPNQAETLLNSLERAAAGIGLHVNEHKTDYMSYNQTSDISTLDRTSPKLIDKFIYLGSSVSSTENDIDTRLTKAWTAIEKLSIIWKSDQTDKIKLSLFQAVVVSILLYGRTTWTLTKRLEKKLDGNYKRMLRAILNKSWQQHPTRHQLYGHLPPITKTIQARRARHAGYSWRSRDKLKSDAILWHCRLVLLCLVWELNISSLHNYSKII